MAINRAETLADFAPNAGSALTASSIGTSVQAFSAVLTGITSAPSNGQLLIGNGTGYTRATLTGTANQVTVTNGAGTITLALPQAVATTSNVTFNDVTVSGNLVVNGTTVTVNSATMTLDDPIITLGGDIAPTVDDNKDRGVEFRWHTGTASRVGFFGFDDSTGRFTFIPNATNSSEVFSGTAGDIEAGTFYGAFSGSGAAITGLNAGNISTGTLAVANGGTGVTSSTGTGSNVLSNSPTLVTPNLGTPSAVTLTNATGLPLSGGITGTLPVANGGTGSNATPTNGQLLIGNGTNFTLSALTGTANQITVTNGAGSVTLALPQNINTGASPTFNALSLTTTLTVGTSTQVNNLNAQYVGGKSAPSGTIVGTSDTQTLTNKTITDATFSDGYTEEFFTANTGSAFTISLANGTIQYLTLTASCTFTFPSATAGRSFTVLLKQDATGGRAVTWPASLRWPYATAPTITTTANYADRFVFVADGATWWGSVAGQSYVP